MTKFTPLKHIKFAITLIALIVVSLNTTWGQTLDEVGFEEEGTGMSPLTGFNGGMDGMGDMEGMDGQDGKGGKRDSTKKNRITRPLESYFFSDSIRARENFLWTIDKDNNRVNVGSIDTTLYDWRIDYIYQKDGVGDMSLGGLGQASQAISYYERANYEDNKFVQQYDSYIFTVENTPFYNVKHAFTQFSYMESGQTSYRESTFGILHAQNINPSSGIAIDYRSNSTKGEYYRQDSKNHNLAVTAYHTGRQYSVQAGYLNNDIEMEENGGIVGIWTIRDSIFEMPNGVPMKLSNASAANQYANNTFFIKQSYGVPFQSLSNEDLTMGDKTAIYFGHTFEYNQWRKLYTDVYASYTNDLASVDSLGNYTSETGYYYDNWFINPESTRDSISETTVSNRLFIQAQPWSRDAIVGTVDGGIGVDIHTYSQFTLASYASGEYDTERRTDIFVYGSADGGFKRYFSWGGSFKTHISGERIGDMKVRGDIKMQAFLRDKPFILSAAFSNELRSPNYWQENLFSNHFVFNTPLSKENITKAEVTLHIPSFNLEVGAKGVMTDSQIYYDNSSNVAQASGITTVTSIYLQKTFKLGGLNLDHRALAQWSTNQIVAPVPDLSAYIAYFYEFWADKNRILKLQIGVDCRYTTRYYMPSYNPALSTFYNQQSEEIGAYPYTSAYVTGKWKRMRIIVKYQHANQYVFGNDEYFTVAGYPQNPAALKVGFSWSFYD